MTRSMRTKICCQHCGNPSTYETEFERWFRGQGMLDSVRNGVVRFDLDVLLHRYTFSRNRDKSVQAMMFIEVKCFGAGMTESQWDTLGILNDLLSASNGSEWVKAYSRLEKKEMTLFLFGGHVLRMSHGSPETSELMTWDGREITEIELLHLLRFERHPRNFKQQINLAEAAALA